MAVGVNDLGGGGATAALAGALPGSMAATWPFYLNPLNHAGVVHYWDGITGPNPEALAFANGRLPAVLVPSIVAQFGQSGGGVSIF